MEKSVGTGLEPFIRKIPGMKQIVNSKGQHSRSIHFER